MCPKYPVQARTWRGFRVAWKPLAVRRPFFYSEYLFFLNWLLSCIQGIAVKTLKDRSDSETRKKKGKKRINAFH